MKLSDGDSVKTGSGGSVLIVFFEGSVMEIYEESEVVISQMQVADTGSTGIRLMQMVGKTVNRVEQMVDPASKYDVETPAGSAVVLGTTFYVQVGDQGFTTVQCHWGNLTFSAGGVSVGLPGGMQSSAAPGGTPSPPQWIGWGQPPPAPSPTPVPQADLGVTVSGDPDPVVVVCEQLAHVSSAGSPGTQAGEPIVGISINRMPSPPDSVPNDSTGVVQLGWSINYNTTADFYALHVRGPGTEGPTVYAAQFPSQPAPPIDNFAGEHSPIIRDLLTDPYYWTVPSGTPPGQYWASLEYYSVETGPIVPEDSASTSLLVHAPLPLLTYTVTVTNLGPSDASGVHATNTLPPGVTFVSATASRGTATTVGEVVTWQIGALVSGASERLTIVVTVDEGTMGAIFDAAVVAGEQYDPDPSNNQCTESTTISCETSVSCSMTGGVAEIETKHCA